MGKILIASFENSFWYFLPSIQVILLLSNPTGSHYSMSRRKPKPIQQKFNPINYLKTGNARKLPIFECLLPIDWQEIKKFPVICARKHVNGNITFASVLVDLMCTGAKDVVFFVNEPEFFYRDIISRYEEDLMMKFEKTSYELIHNIIFESVAFAEDYGIAPSEDFRWAEYILEEDSDDFPRMDIPLGQDGKAILYLNDVDERKNYFERQIKAFGEPGTYQIIYDDYDFDEEFDEDEEFEEDDEDLDVTSFLEETCMNWDEEKWGEFYDKKEFDHLPYDIVLHLFHSMIDRTYGELKEDKLFAPFMNIEYGLEVDYHPPLSEYHLDLVFDIRDQVYEVEGESSREVQKVLKKIDREIIKNPDLVLLYKYKWEALMDNRQHEKALELALMMKEKFPKSIFSISCHALSLAILDNDADLPEAMGNFTRIQDFDQRKAPFHIEEISAFYSPWLWYFAKTNQIIAAYFLNCMMLETQAQIYFPMPDFVFDEYFEGLERKVRPFLNQLVSGKISKSKFIDMVLNW